MLSWCAEAGIGQVTVFVASIDNLHKRAPAEVDFLMHLAERVIGAALVRCQAARLAPEPEPPRRSGR